MDGPHAPAVMLEHPLKRGRPVDVADQPDRGRVEVGRDCDRCSSAALMTGSIVR